MKGIRLAVQIAELSLLLFLALLSILPAHAETLVDTPRFTLYMPGDSARRTAETASLDDLARNALSILDSTYEELGALYDARPKSKVVLRFLTPEDFHRRTNAPAWTSAMFLGGEISIPVAPKKRVNLGELNRAIRHEYVHAVIAEISGKGCPAWIDEGLAQLFEGEVNPLLGPALRDWIETNESLPLAWLQNGFLTLDDNVVPVAYAQSLFATRFLVDRYGYPAVTGYLGRIREATPNPFSTSFGISEAEFEKTLTREIRAWSMSGLPHP